MYHTEQMSSTRNNNFEKEASLLYEALIKKPEIIEALNLLDTLPEGLYYHTKAHTLDVIYETILFAQADTLPQEVIEQQAISAAWHDVGYIERTTTNESIAIDLFKSSAAYTILSPEQRTEIIANIMDTELVITNGSPSQRQHHSTYGYALDGDLSNFGRKDFFEKRTAYAKELGIDLSATHHDSGFEKKMGFLKFTLNLLKNHTWKTPAGQRLRQAQTEENIRYSEIEYQKLLST